MVYDINKAFHETIIREDTRMQKNVKQMIDMTIDRKTKENPMLARIIKAKLVLKGIDPESLSGDSGMDPSLVKRIESVLAEFK
jgi:hypothetical protein